MKPKACGEAHGLLHQMKTSNFHFNLQCWKQVLDACDILSKYLQSGSIDITTTFDLIGGFKEQFAKLRTDDSFEKLKVAANNSLAACGIEEDFVPSRKFATPADADT